MLGEKLGQETGNITSRRVLESDGPPIIEVSFATQGTLLGVNVRHIGTYKTTVRQDGTMFGEGQGIYMGAGGEMASWKGQGIGTFTETGGTAFRGSVFYSTATEAWASLNKVAGIFEFSENADGTTLGDFWEWK
jgi:hypothetical protein